MKTWQTYGKCGDIAHLLDNPDEESREKRSILYYFFEGYEQSAPYPENLDVVTLGYEVEGGTIPDFVDAICGGCPVREQCLGFAVDNGETGVYAGMYLTRGKYDKEKNSHKTDDKAEKLWETFR